MPRLIFKLLAVFGVTAGAGGIAYPIYKLSSSGTKEFVTAGTVATELQKIGIDSSKLTGINLSKHDEEKCEKWNENKEWAYSKSAFFLRCKKGTYYYLYADRNLISKHDDIFRTAYEFLLKEGVVTEDKLGDDNFLKYIML